MYININTYQCHELLVLIDFENIIYAAYFCGHFNGGFGCMPGENVLELIRLIIHTYIHICI